MTVLPFATPVGTSPTLLWERTTLSGSIGIVNWKIKIISISQYQLFKNNVFFGVYNLNTEYTLTEIKLNVLSGPYTISDVWTFTTYKSFGSFDLVELSIPTSQSENITVNAIGGI